MINKNPSFSNFSDVKKALVQKFGKTTSSSFLTRCCILAILESSFFEQVMFENDWRPSHLLDICKNDFNLKEYR